MQKFAWKKIGAATGKATGQLVSVDAYGGIKSEETCYKITRIDDQEFAKEGVFCHTTKNKYYLPMNTQEMQMSSVKIYFQASENYLTIFNYL